MSVQCIRTSVQCIQAKTTWLPTLLTGHTYHIVGNLVAAHKFFEKWDQQSMVILLSSIFLLSELAFVCFDALHPSQQFFSDVRTISFFFVSILYLPVKIFSVLSGWVFLGWTSSKQRIDKVSCPMTQHSALGEAQSPNPLDHKSSTHHTPRMISCFTELN